MHSVCIFMSLGKADLSKPCCEPSHCAHEIETTEDFEDQVARHDTSPGLDPSVASAYFVTQPSSLQLASGASIAVPT